MGVLLRVVVQDPTGEELVFGKPKLRVLREHQRGGVVDTRARPPKFVGPSRRPQVWYCGEAQEQLVLHPDSEPPRLLVYGAMGAGKTEVLSMWAWLQIIALTGTGLQVGLVAPVQERAEMIRDAMIRRAPQEWFQWREGKQLFRFANGVTGKLVSTHVASAAEGSRIQGYNWAVCASDEIQDSVAADADVEARGRAAPGGNFKRLATCTPKDDPSWRSFADERKKSDLWGFKRMEGITNPFVPPEYWERMRLSGISLRDYQRRALGMDLGPERAVYPTWSRDENLRPVPAIGARDVTAEVLGRLFPGSNYTVLVGHDPGQLCNASEILKAYLLAGDDVPTWWVVDEVTTDSTTTEQHAHALIRRLQSRWRVNEVDRKGRPVDGGARAHVRVDPHSKIHTNSDAKPDENVIKVLRNLGLDARPAAYSQVNPTEPGVIPREAAIEMIVGLLCSASGKRRLFVACDDRHQPAAPRLVEALETMERDEGGRSERERKRKGEDRSHWPAALRYALWVLEQPRYGGRSVATR